MDWERVISVVSGILGIAGFFYAAAQKNAMKILAIEHREEFERHESMRKELCEKCEHSHQDTIKILRSSSKKATTKKQETVNA